MSLGISVTTLFILRELVPALFMVVVAVVVVLFLLTLFNPLNERGVDE